MGPSLFRITFISIALSFVYACSHPIEIDGEGDVMSASGERTCLLSNFLAGDTVCNENYALGNYQETYYPVPHVGWQFDHWVHYCADAAPPNYECSFNISATAVRKHWGQTLPALQAVFVPAVDTDGDGLFDHVDPCPLNPTNPCALITDSVTVNSTEWSQVDLFMGLSWGAISAVCPAGVCGNTATLNGFDLNGWVWASVSDINALFNVYLSARGVSANDLLGPVAPDTFSGSFGSLLRRDPLFMHGWRPTYQNENGSLRMVDGWSATLAPGVDGAYHPAYILVGNTIGSALTAETSFDEPFSVPVGFPPIPNNPGAWFYRDSAH